MKIENTTKTAAVEITRRIEGKWGMEVIAAGYLVWPSVLLQRQQAFGLDSLDMNILMQIADHWWEPEAIPFRRRRR